MKYTDAEIIKAEMKAEKLVCNNCSKEINKKDCSQCKAFQRVRFIFLPKKDK